MWQAEVRVDLDAIRDNVALLRAGTDRRGHGGGQGRRVRARHAAGGPGGARAAARPGSGVCTLDEALTLRRAGITAPVLAWLLAPGLPLHEGVAADVDLGAGEPGPARRDGRRPARRAGRPARVHLKIDTGLARGGATPADWPALVEAAAKAQADGDGRGRRRLEPLRVRRRARPRDHRPAARRSSPRALAVAERLGVTPALRHIANSAATLTRPDAHFDLVRPGIAVYGLSPVAGRALRPAAGDDRPRPGDAHQAGAGRAGRLVRAHLPHRRGRPRSPWCRSGTPTACPGTRPTPGPVQLGGKVRTIAGRVCMDQIVLDCGDDPVAAGDVATLFGRGDDGEPTADDWAEAVGTINYEIVTRFGSARVPRVYDGGGAEREPGVTARRSRRRASGPACVGAVGRCRRGRVWRPASRSSGPLVRRSPSARPATRTRTRSSATCRTTSS